MEPKKPWSEEAYYLDISTTHLSSQSVSREKFWMDLGSPDAVSRVHNVESVVDAVQILAVGDDCVVS